MKNRELRVRLLEEGCVPVRISGSHEIWRMPDGRTFPTTCAHMNSDVTRFVRRTILRLFPGLKADLLR